MKLTIFSPLFFILVMAFPGIQISAAEKKAEGRVERYKRTAKEMWQYKKTIAAFGAVVSAGVLYLYRAQKVENRDSIFLVVSAPQEVKNCYPKIGVLVIEDFKGFKSQFSLCTQVHIGVLQEQGLLKVEPVGTNTYKIDAWKVLDEIAKSRSKLGPKSPLARDLKEILEPLKLEKQKTVPWDF